MDIKNEIIKAIEELNANPNPSFRKIKLLVVGCSTSEIAGGVIGHASQPNLGEDVAGAILETANKLGFDAAFQCCEHLNRALVMEEAAAEKYGYEIVAAVPHPKAGGSCASAAYRMMEKPVLVEAVSADAGLDIGQTLIGMHLKRVAVPVRLSMDKIGSALITAARTRPALIGGERAKYTL
ncbi:MAG: TIGR01440 family protein [Clostridia bacterium]|nr:TIGR01440 family protein [Clostridia bacterium]MBQ9855126.1 TIGR01440 family protein [Clostridia bacterium]